MQKQEANPQTSSEGGMSLIAHLDELRIRLLRYLVVFVICLLATYGLRKDILDVIRAPVEGPLQKYSQAPTVNAASGSSQFLGLDDYNCSCTRVSTQVITRSFIPADQPATSVRPNFPLATASSSRVGDKIDQVKGATVSEWRGYLQSTYRDFLAFYYSMRGNDSKAAELLELSQSATLKKGAVYQAGSGDILELNCQCVRDKDKPKPGAMVYIGLPELFFAQMKVAIYSAVFISFPYLLIELWGFVGPALYKDEQLVFWGFGISTLLFFTGGALFGYFVVFPFGFDFFLSLSQPGEIMPSLAIGEYLDFTLKLFMAFGLIFELPVAVFVLARLGIVTPKLMITQARPAMIVILILSAVLTPPDPFTMLLMAGPLAGLYLFSILVCFMGLNKKKAKMRAQGINPEEFD